MKNSIKNTNESEIKSGKLNVLLIFIIILISSIILSFIFKEIIIPLDKTPINNTSDLINKSSIINDKSSLPPTSTPYALPPIPSSTILSNGSYHIFQSFNNCGPAALSMALRFYGINVSQEILGQSLRPYQIPGGDNDDKSVTFEEVAQKSKEYDLVPFLRPMGNDQILKQFIANGMPIIARTWTKTTEDIGHFRVVKGYDDNQKVFIQDDSLQGHDLQYSYEDFNELWKKFNYEYLVLVPKEKEDIAKQIIDEDIDEKIAWEKAKNNSLKELETTPNNIDDRFNLSVAYYHLGEFQKSVEEFEKVESQLPFRTLWYQTEPIKSYYELGNDARVLEISEQILNNQNRAFSELYILRGKIYEKQGNSLAAKSEFEKALFYNQNLKEAIELNK